MEHPLAACPLCPEWQTWLAECFAELAREVRPLAIWMEDDWRLHNHGAVTGWGGCFCPTHLRRFSEMIGQKVTREQVLAAVLHGGDPHPWRQAWLDLSRETILEPTRAITDAIRQTNPTTRVGWMTSMPDQHSVEGRDWARLREASGESGAFLIRLHMPPYTQQRPLRVTIQTSDPEQEPARSILTLPKCQTLPISRGATERYAIDFTPEEVTQLNAIPEQVFSAMPNNGEINLSLDVREHGMVLVTLEREQSA
jgi:hypothetical protein